MKMRQRKMQNNNSRVGQKMQDRNLRHQTREVENAAMDCILVLQIPV